MTITPLEYAGWSALALENEHTRLVVLPELGAKIVSLVAKRSGTEFLWQDPSRPYRTPIFGDLFGNYDISGFDECFPTIADCPYPEAPWEGVVMADHGELWCAPWRAEANGDNRLYLHAYGVRFGYHFEKWITLAEDAAHFTIHYRLTNLTPFTFKSIWSAHPLFAAEEGMRILFPGTPTMRMTFANGGRVGGELFIDRTWPWVEDPAGNPLDYSRMIGPTLDANDKVYVDTPPEGWCALYRPASHEYVGFTLSAAEVPFVGVCLKYADKSTDADGSYWAAVEPCTGWPDRVDEAMQFGAHGSIDGWATQEWTLGMRLGTAANEQLVGAQLVGAIPM